MRHLAVTILLLLFATAVHAQDSLTYAEVLEKYPEAKAARVSVLTAPTYAEPDRASEITGEVTREDEIAVYGETEEFWRVAVRPQGDVGYVAKAAIEVRGPASRHASSTTYYGESRSNTRPANYKDPSTAQLFGFLVTGAGHVYSGEAEKGLLLFGIGVGAPLIGYRATVSSIDIDCTGSGCADNTDYSPLFIGGLVGVGAWIYSVLDADDAARRNNSYYAVRPATDGPGLALAILIR